MSTAAPPGPPPPDSDNNDGIAARAVSGSAYSIGASLITWALGALRLVLLMRLLLPADFGVFTQAALFLSLALQLAGFGFNSALIHRKDTDQRWLGTYFTLRVGLLALVLIGLAALTPWLSGRYPDMPALSTLMMALILLEPMHLINNVQTTILTKRLAFRRLSAADVTGAIVMTIVAPLAAWLGLGVWSLALELFSGYLGRALILWTAKSAWRPRFVFDRAIARWFMDFGWKVWLSTNLTYMLDRFDDFWIGGQLGKTSLGFYSRAYETARYPRRLVANPLLSVFFPTFARLQDDRTRLSRAFFRATSVMVRFGGWVSLVLVLTAPEFIVVVFGERWLPMVRTFQLMIVYTLLDPLSLSASNLLTAVGHPGAITRVRFVQVIVFIPAVVGLGSLAGIEGVALAADLMVFIGAVLLFRRTKRYVDYSHRALWLWPLVGVAVTAALVLALESYWFTMITPLWTALIAKSILITALYGGILWLTERDQLLSGLRMIWSLTPPHMRKRFPFSRQ